MPHRQVQIPLPLLLRPEARFDEFIPGPNGLALAAVRSVVLSGNDPYLFLCGPSGTGKTHLLHAACQAAIEQAHRAVYLPLGEPSLAPAVLDGLEQLWLVTVDDVQNIAGNRDWERALFDLFNRLRDAGRRLLVASDRSLGELPFELADLRSRLGWGPAFRLQPLADADCEALLRQAACRRGLKLEEPAIAYLMRRVPRDVRALLAVLDALDQASLREKRRPTVPLIRALLNEGR